ncbi:hypothetical protein B0H17DRAFT_1221439 [Mycena rosella]|uniref:Uncharacterized protein n=1 Tax=Mycena rosella TaxID=1033263 RepID=A0AAD7F8K1_MYCRO|nr:hypothetical protein B0H17DRAFT_1221439 [Mycena rosella]
MSVYPPPCRSRHRLLLVHLRLVSEPDLRPAGSLLTTLQRTMPCAKSCTHSPSDSAPGNTVDPACWEGAAATATVTDRALPARPCNFTWRRCAPLLSLGSAILLLVLALRRCSRCLV